MTPASQTVVMLAQAEERLRQERETFEQRKQQDALWFRLRLTMGFIAAFLLPVFAVSAGYVVVRHDQFPSSVVNAAAAVIFVDVAGLLIAVWKLVLNPTSTTAMEPVTPSVSNVEDNQ